MVQKVPVFTRFDIFPYLDVGGNLAIRIGYDNMAPLLPIIPPNNSFDELNDPDSPGETTALMESFGLRNVSLKRYRYASRVSYFVVN